MSRRTELTRRGRLVIGTAALLLIAGTGVVVAHAFGDGPDCRVGSGGRTVDLTRAQAESITTGVAPRGREGRSTGQVVRRFAPDLSADDVEVVVAAVNGKQHAALFCNSGGAGTSESDGLDDNGLTARAERVHQDLLASFGDLPLGGFAPGGVTQGHMPGSAHYEGRAIDVFFRPISAASKTRGWALAQYLVAHAERLAIETVIFDDRIWTANRAADAWRRYVVPDPQNAHNPAELAILQHRDHVHVDVTD